MFTVEQVRAWTPKELERRVYALAPDAGGFSVPVVQAIVKKLHGPQPQRDPTYGER